MIVVAQNLRWNGVRIWNLDKLLPFAKNKKIESSQHGNVEYSMLAMKFKELKLFRLDFC